MALLCLPNELVFNILGRLAPQDLAGVAATCKALAHHAGDDRLWQAIVQDSVPGVVMTPNMLGPFASFRQLFLAHYPHWFLTRYKIWIGSESMAGKIVIARYDPATACIRGYQLLAIKPDARPGSPVVLPMPAHDLFDDDDFDNETINDASLTQSVHVYLFDPEIHLHLDRPVLSLGPRPDATALRCRLPSAWVRPEPMASTPSDGTDTTTTTGHRSRIASHFVYARALPDDEERRSSTFALPQQMRSSAIMSKPGIIVSAMCAPGSPTDTQVAPASYFLVPPRTTTASRDLDHIHLPYGLYRVWPPPNVPTRRPGASAAGEHRVYCVEELDDTAYLRPQDYPMSIAQASDRAFHICAWDQLSVPMGVNGGVRNDNGTTPPPRAVPGSVFTHTFATIDPYYYTPTADKPFRGIWVGDFAGHGCEFLLMHQPDDLESSARRESGDDAGGYRGSLEAIKLTGDANVPRGEYSFFAANLSGARVLQMGPFAGARIVPSEGHVAGHGFRNDRFITSRLIIISTDRLAQFWTASGYVSFFQRVDIDRYTRE